MEERNRKETGMENTGEVARTSGVGQRQKGVEDTARMVAVAAKHS